jgi:uncharacterized protein with HEPN domain
MMNKPAYFLNDILKSLQYIDEFTADGREAFLRDEKTQDAVMYVYEVIGASVKGLPVDLLATQSNIDWQGLAELEDFLVEHYDEIELTEIWSEVERLPTLRAAVEELLASIADEESE